MPNRPTKAQASGGEDDSALSGPLASPRPQVSGGGNAISWSRTRWLGTLALLFTLLVLQWSSWHGRLAQEITVDDSVYFTDAFHRLQDFYQGGIVPLPAGLLQSPPHS